MLVDSVKLAEEEILELKLSVLADKEAVLDACEVDGLTDQEIESLTDGDVLTDLVKLTEEDILELKLRVLTDKEVALDALTDILELKLTALSDEEPLLRVSDVDGLTDKEME